MHYNHGSGNWFRLKLTQKDVFQQQVESLNFPSGQTSFHYVTIQVSFIVVTYNLRDFSKRLQRKLQLSQISKRWKLDSVLQFRYEIGLKCLSGRSFSAWIDCVTQTNVTRCCFTSLSCVLLWSSVKRQRSLSSKTTCVTLLSKLSLICAP